MKNKIAVIFIYLIIDLIDGGVNKSKLLAKNRPDVEC
jgi:hypothetical protein